MITATVIVTATTVDIIGISGPPFPSVTTIAVTTITTDWRKIFNVGWQ